MKSSDRIFARSVYLLRFFAGYLNVMAILIFSQMLAGHTGSLTNAALEFIEGDYWQMIRLLILTSFFFIGTIVSGIFFPSKYYDRRINYGRVFIVWGCIIILFGLFSTRSFYFMLFLAFILGFQNAMFVFYKGMVVRTTILTGTLTDIGLEIGRRLHGHSTEDWKFYFHIRNVLFYLIGATMAASLFLYSSLNIVMIGGFIALMIGFYFLTINSKYQIIIDEFIKES